MWNHYCPADKSVIATGAGEPCNWCDAAIVIVKEHKMAEVDRWVLLSTEETTRMEFDPENGPREVIIPVGSVLNIMLWDGVSEWAPPEGTRVMREADYLAERDASPAPLERA